MSAIKYRLDIEFNLVGGEVYRKTNNPPMSREECILLQDQTIEKLKNENGYWTATLKDGKEAVFFSKSVSSIVFKIEDEYNYETELP